MERTATKPTVHLPIIVFTHCLDKKFIALLVCKENWEINFQQEQANIQLNPFYCLI